MVPLPNHGRTAHLEYTVIHDAADSPALIESTYLSLERNAGLERPAVRNMNVKLGEWQPCGGALCCGAANRQTSKRCQRCTTILNPTGAVGGPLEASGAGGRHVVACSNFVSVVLHIHNTALAGMEAQPDSKSNGKFRNGGKCDDCSKAPPFEKTHDFTRCSPPRHRAVRRFLTH